MDTVTYPHPSVIASLMNQFVPCQLESGKNAELARKLGIRWLPGLVIVDKEERPAHSVVGFLPPSDLLVELSYGRAILAMGAKRYDEAHALFAEVARTEGAERAPEACFWWGISKYRQTKDFSQSVKEPWGTILERWPKTQWARKVGYALGVPPLLA